jgi:predicted DNA-binding protein with PD1-like motif
MNLNLLALSAALLAPAALAQRTRVEIVKPTTPHDDSKPNNPDVPEAYAVSTQFERIVIFRFKYQADLLAGIEKLVKQERIRNAVILSAIGSVRNYHLHTVSNREFPSKNVFTKDPNKPMDIVSMNGYVIGGRVHAHMTLTDEEKAFAGHLEPDTNVFTFAIVTLGILSDKLDLSRLDDKTYR